MLPDSDAFMAMLKNKEQVITMIFKDLDSCDKNQAAFTKLENLYEDGKSVDIDKAMAACAKALRHSNDVNRRLLMLMLVYTAGGDYSADCAKTLSKLGHGKEALQEMLKQKMNGTY